MSRMTVKLLIETDSQLTLCYFLPSGLLDNVTVLIGIAYRGKAIAGVINQPFYNYQVRTKHYSCMS